MPSGDRMTTTIVGNVVTVEVETDEAFHNMDLVKIGTVFGRLGARHSTLSKQPTGNKYFPTVKIVVTGVITGGGL